ncbi:uncharacterized protein LOC124644159 [Helicoverpa zea]|uniref:uncharacterized protein LOC124644159 n=1 Tax=Helicoverpa zea TaxID=7113 RepID=UPI001F55D23D|nr:uncharacterized protein LOC124644159 [Helicoverpa zea]
MYFCEDHFDLPNDMENYMEYHVMGFVSQVRMKPDILPSKFDCQPDRRKRASSGLERPCALKRQRMTIIAECLNKTDSSIAKTTPVQEKSPVINEDLQKTRKTEDCLNKTVESSIASTSSVQGESSVTNSDSHMIRGILQEPKKTANKCVQVLLTKKYRSKATQTQKKSVDQAASPPSPFRYSKNVSTSPFKVEHVQPKLSRPSGSGISKKLLWEEDNSDSDFSLCKSTVTHSESSPSTKSTSGGSETVKQEKKSIEAVQNIINKIKNKPRFYIGIPKSSYFLLDIISKETNISIENLMLCLKKIRLDTKNQELADDFAMTPSNVTKIFFKHVLTLASVLRPFIVNIDKELNRKTLPIAFRHKYYNVSCIIDCLEIEVQKPSKSVNQALTWSEYKKANTIKYLISCTPNGLVNYISQGFGGRTTDTCLVESCDFVNTLEKGMVVMADRGFKHIEQFLLKSRVQLVRPPSVQSGGKLSKVEAKQTKQIASLRIHVERVIRRLREFNMLRPHACVNTNHVKILDDIITIACALINLQDSLIK